MRTPEQVAALNALDEAIKNARLSFIESEEDKQDGIIIQWLVTYVSRFWDDDGDPLTAVGRIVSNPEPSIHEQLGMHEYDMTNLRRAITMREDIGGD